MLGNSIVWSPVAASASSTIVNPKSDETGGIELALGNNGCGANDDEAGRSSGVEVALADDSYDADDDDDLDDESGWLQALQPRITGNIPFAIHKVFTEINPPFDMANKCRKIADGGACQAFLKNDDINDPRRKYLISVLSCRS